MIKKLTLSMDPKAIESAKKYAETAKAVALLKGAVGLVPPNFDYKKAVEAHIYEKHVKRCRLGNF